LIQYEGSKANPLCDLIEGAVRLDQPVADVIPEFGGNGKDAVTIEQVMCHQGGFPRAPMGPPDWDRRDARLGVYGRWRLTLEPGTLAYHATAAHWVLADVIEAVDGVDYRASMRRRLFDPLGILNPGKVF